MLPLLELKILLKDKLSILRSESNLIVKNEGIVDFLAFIFNKIQDYKLSLEFSENAKRINPNRPEAYHNLADSYLNINDLIDIAFHIEINKWKKTNKIQLNLVDIEKHKSIINLKLHKRLYKCQMTDCKNVLVTNSRGQCFSSDLSKSSDNLNKKQIVFAKKILSFAEIALGKAA